MDEFDHSGAAGAQREAQAFQVAVAILVSALADIVDKLAPGHLDTLTFSGAPDDPEATAMVNRHLDSLLRRSSPYRPDGAA